MIASFLDAARRGDAVALDSLIDWPISGVGILVRALHDMDPDGRAEAGAAGLRNLLIEGSSAAGESFPLGSTVSRLAKSPRSRAPTDRERSDALDRLGVPSLPSEIDDSTAAALRGLADVASSVAEVYVVDYDTERTLALGLIPDRPQVAIVRKL